ncbi:uncharacterized protein STEHIDRAFT_148524 [Stereum hirsutum FP-91666 SS1]|uniref:uncharacterized protein n=1 Tax=Stereum hirsutum (strain FP-91666) TaxID=721885 RepID=UPI000444940F|nr:uncharacterized protein STEHIDRAFT_148524 [Stereum hirsutum FP-91666 SS1]EIM84507.1 hypothetical protein STEHIDRAFT_148524 [Stereum hirsutum FP-91666 SS1]
MALRIVKRRVSSMDGLGVAKEVASFVKDISNMSQFAPVAVAAALILRILELLQAVKTNQVQCFELARRAAKLLLNISRRMENKWHTAPHSLIENIREFEEILRLIYDLMQQAANVRWLQRLLSKSTIETTLAHCNVLLDDASRSFQIESLIEIHYAVGALRQNAVSEPLLTEGTEVVAGPLPMDFSSPSVSVLCHERALLWPDIVSQVHSPSSTQSYASVSEVTEQLSISEANGSPAVNAEAIELQAFRSDISMPEDEFGFRRYHQSDVRIRAVNRKSLGWFSGSSQAEVNGNMMQIKKYDGPKGKAARDWIRDIKILRNLYHVNLPQLLGYSDDKTPTPFILLAHSQPRDVQTYLKAVLQTSSLSSSVLSLLRMYRDVTSAASYVQQQMSLKDHQVQDFLEEATYAVDAENKLVLGLPPRKEGIWSTARSYNLTESLAKPVLTGLGLASQSIDHEPAQHTQHLRHLLTSLLPRRTDTPSLPPPIQDLLDDHSEGLSASGHGSSLAALREISFSSNTHTFSWQRRAPVGQFQPGDFGYLPYSASSSGRDIDMEQLKLFQKLGNVFDGGMEKCNLDIAKRLSGSMRAFSGRHGDNQVATPYLLPGGLEGWPVAVPPRDHVTVWVTRESSLESIGEAWRYLLQNANQIMERHGKQPHELIIIASETTVQDFTIKDHSLPPLPHPNRSIHSQHTHHPHFGALSDVPKILYLFTSSSMFDLDGGEQKVREPFVPYWTDDPMGRPSPRETRSTIRSFGENSGWPVGYVRYIQLDPEDVTQYL